MILWLLRILGMENDMTLELMGIDIILSTLLALDGIWFLLLISDAVNDYIERRKSSGRTKKSLQKNRS